MRAGLVVITGLTDGAVFSEVSGTSAITLIFVFAVSHTHTPVLTGQIAAWVHCGRRRRGHIKDCEWYLCELEQVETV